MWSGNGRVIEGVHYDMRDYCNLACDGKVHAFYTQYPSPKWTIQSGLEAISSEETFEENQWLVHLFT